MIDSQQDELVKILDYWRAIEFFTPQAVPKLEDKHIFDLLEGGPAPWEKSHPLQIKPCANNKEWRYSVFCGLYSLQSVKDAIEKFYGKDEEIEKGITHGDTCTFAFNASSRGELIDGSFVLSNCAWAIRCIINQEPELIDHLEENLTRDLAENFKGILQNLSDDNGAYAKLNHAVERILKQLKLESFLPSVRVRVQAILVDKQSEEDRLNEEQEHRDLPPLNSFFIQDLHLVKQSILRGECGNGLEKILAPQRNIKRFDLRKDPSLSYHYTAPHLFPKGCWPSNGSYSLALSQQFAINVINQDLKNQPGLLAVNGPPGTGKTTLLRDAFAAVVVERAILLSGLDAPQEAFANAHQPQMISHWKEQFQGYEMIVASNNNGAVDNISLEMPKKEAIDPKWLEKYDYFKDISTNVLGKPAWGLITARLGSKKNCNAFFSKFWLSNKKAGFKEYLSSNSGSVNWKASVKRFQAALAKEQEIRAFLSFFYHTSQKLEELKQENSELAKDIQTLKQQYVGLKKIKTRELTLLTNQQQLLDLAYLKRKEHQNQFPSILEIIVSFSQAFFEWKSKKALYQEEVERYEAQVESFKRSSQQAEEALLELEEIGLAKKQRLKEVAEEIKRSEHLLKQCEEANFVEIPSLHEWLANEYQREQAAIWDCPEWREARERLFLEALKLHQEFISLNKERFLDNLEHLYQWLLGTSGIKMSARDIESAWTTFFFVVPIVSTTFASFARLFRKIGREKLGWLFIDEAGQAHPQASVGAIWRSKRTVIIGDQLQLEPVVAMPLTAQEALRQHYAVEDIWLPSKASVQALADRVSHFGTYLTINNKQHWLSMPLRVHRRCNRPIFDIINSVFYDDLMLFGTSEKSLEMRESCWIDVRSQVAEKHWIPEEGRALRALLDEIPVHVDRIFLITPFKSIEEKLFSYRKLRPNIDVGTIHKMQGKEADVVILVLGGDPQKPSAKRLVSAKPNLLNVAVSRAKKRLFIIGNKKDWSSLEYMNAVCHLIINNELAVVPLRSR